MEVEEGVAEEVAVRAELLPTRRDASSGAVQSFPPTTSKYRNLFAFWMLGLLNNSSYVIMIAGVVTDTLDVEGRTTLRFSCLRENL
jgi:hypothetical protein